MHAWRSNCVGRVPFTDSFAAECVLLSFDGIAQEASTFKETPREHQIIHTAFISMSDDNFNVVLSSDHSLRCIFGFFFYGAGGVSHPSSRSRPPRQERKSP